MKNIVNDYELLSRFFWLTLFGVGMSLVPFATAAGKTVLRNDAYSIEVQEDGALAIRAATGGESVTFRPKFVAMVQKGALTTVGAKSKTPIYNLINWKLPDGRVVDDVFQIGERVELRDPKVAIAGDSVKWDFTSTSLQIAAEVTLPKGNAEPRITYTATFTEGGNYSIAYSGAPGTPLKDVKELWMPLAWDGRRLPPDSILIPDEHCSIPGCLVQNVTATIGVMADPRQFPYEMPNQFNRRFGVTVRDASGLAQPLVFAPFPGARNSKFAAGGKFTFAIDLVVQPTALNATFEHIARGICDFHDRRENTLTSLNQSLDNILDFTLGPWGNFVPANKSFHYPDSNGTVKNVSALHPIGLAVVTDNEKLFHEQGVPILEYVMSRQKLLFAINDEGVKSSQKAGADMGGPCVSVSELAALQQMTGGATPVFLDEAKRLYGEDRALNMEWISKGASWQNDLWLYRATGDKKSLQSAREKADNYIAERIEKQPADFSETGTGTFFDYMIPWWKDLYELYQDTHDPKYLDAAHKGARRYAQFIWFYPVVPDGDITVNKDGFASRRGSEQPGLIPVKEETVPAWRVSDQGLMCEGNGTVARLGILLATHAPYFLRIAQETNDPFLRDIARSAVIGRYASFPGYHINTRFSTAQEKEDFPKHPFEQLKVTTSFHYNHTLPMANMVLDYLMAEAYDRSARAVEFPSEYAECYAYMGSQVYGAPGVFYDQRDVRPWMPRALVKTDSVQVNYVAGRGKDSVCVALMNESDRTLENVTVTLDPAYFDGGLSGAHPVQVWRDNKRDSAPFSMTDGAFKVSLSPKGITAFIVTGVRPKATFQDEVAPVAANAQAVTHRRISTPFGEVDAMVFSFGPKLTWLYAYVRGGKGDLASATMEATVNGRKQTVEDTTFPFEFSLPLQPGDKAVDVTFEGVKGSGEKMHSDSAQLSTGF